MDIRDHTGRTIGRDDKFLIESNPGDDVRTRRRFRVGSVSIETNVEGFDPMVLRGMSAADLRAIVDKPD